MAWRLLNGYLEATGDYQGLDLLRLYAANRALVQAALYGVNRTDREAFLLYGMEGFSLNEIASITGRHPEAVRESVQRARECVRNSPPVAREFEKDLVVNSRNAGSRTSVSK